MLVPVFGDVAHAVLRALADGRVGNVLAAERDLACRLLLKARQRVDKLRLAVALDTGKTDNLAPAHLKVHVLDGVILVELRGNREILDLQHDLAGRFILLVHLEVDLPSDHHGRELLHGRLARVDGADAFSLAQYRAPVGDGHNFCELVGDEKDGLSFRREIFHDLHELVDFLRGQNCRRLVEDQNLVVPVEHLENFGSLLHTDGDILYLCVRVCLLYTSFLLAVYTQNVGELVVQDAARLAADYNARQTELAKKQALQEQLDAFEAEKEARMQEAEARAEEAMQALTAQYEAEQAAKKAAQEAALLEAEEASMAQADTQEAETAPEQTKASSVFQFNPDNFEWWMLAVAAAVLVLGSGGVLLILHTGKMKEITRDTEQEDDTEDEASE